jgi:ABC-type transport system substrate-binding protein
MKTKGAIRMTSPRQMSRRRLMQLTGGATAGVATGMIGGIPVWTSGASAQSSGGGTLRVAMVGDFIPSFYPLGTWTGNQFLLFTMFYSTLVDLDADLNLRADLADEWEISEDATTFSFKLNPNAKWHDGQPCTSADVAFSFKFYLRDTASVGFTTRLQSLVGAQAYMDGSSDELPGVETPDPQTVVLTLQQPNAFFIKALREPFHFILPEHILSGLTAEDLQTHPFATSSPIGTGPYKFVRMEPDQYVELEANPEYFKGTPTFEKVFQKFLPSELVLAQLESDELDLGLRLNPLEYDRLEAAPNVEAIARPGVGVVELIVNNRSITDKQVRQAFWYAIDRQGIIDGIFDGRGAVLKAPPGMTNYEGLNDYAYDPAQARTLLTDAGWDGRTVRLIYDTVWPAVGDVVPIIQQQLGEVGVTVQLEPLDTAAWTERYRNQPDSWELAWGQGGTEALDPDVSTIYYNGNPDTAIGFYTNPELEALLADGRATGDPAKRDEIYTQAAQLINDEAPVLYLWTPFDVHGKSTRLQGVTVFPYAPETGNDVWTWSFSA